jgi:Coenzyme PQQ synthesis protein D (PqqD).
MENREHRSRQVGPGARWNEEETELIAGPRYARNEHLGFELDGDRAYVELDRGTWAVLDRPAAAIWESVATPRTVPEIVAYLLDRFAGDEPRIAADVRSTLAEWSERGLVVIDDCP